MRYERFATIADMIAFAVKFRIEHEGSVFAEAGIATDNKGLSYEAAVSLVDTKSGALLAVLEFNAYHDAETEISFMGKRAKVEARNAAEVIVDAINCAFGDEADVPADLEGLEIFAATPVAPTKHSKLFMRYDVEGFRAAFDLIEGKSPEEIKAACAVKGSPENFLSRMFAIVRKAEVGATKRGLIGVGVVSYVEARVYAFQRRAARLLCRKGFVHVWDEDGYSWVHFSHNGQFSWGGNKRERIEVSYADFLSFRERMSGRATVTFTPA